MNKQTYVITDEQLQVQLGYCDKISAFWHDQNITPAAYVETYGCQQNEADSEKLRGYLAMSGYRIVQEAEGADVVVMNTCAIREHAEQRVFGNLGALTHTKRRHSRQKIFLCGCMAGETKVSERIRKSYPHVEVCSPPIIFGSSRRFCGMCWMGRSASSMWRMRQAPSRRASPSCGTTP